MSSQQSRLEASDHSRFPTVPPGHEHVRQLLENAFRFVAPQSQTVDESSGYVVEGWNNDPEKGLMLRGFTQLTAIGEWMELLANVLAGRAETPHMTKERALSYLTRVVESLEKDQKNPQASAKGLLGNFLDLAPGKRMGALTGDVEKKRFTQEFGPEKGEALWQALKAKGWITPKPQDREASVNRGRTYGAAFFDGPLAPYSDETTKNRVMALLDHRVVLAVFGDNANLSTSIAKTIGALLDPSIKDAPSITELRQRMDRFLDGQREGYAHLYDAKQGLYSFGWDAYKNRMLGWESGTGEWRAAHMDYMINEFRDPTTFVVIRYGLPLEAVENLGFKTKQYRTQDGRSLHVLAPWEGSAFQALGLGVSMAELEEPSWQRLLSNVVDVEIDFSTQKGLPGFLSESYTGNGTQYTGEVGIPDISVNTQPRLTDAATLYTLGVAYTVAPEKVEKFLAANWSAISKLLTDHGPWEGYNLTRKEAIRVQTSAHTLSLILGFLGTGSADMMKYLETKGLTRPLKEIYRPGASLDLLSGDTNVFAWDDAKAITSKREKGTFQVKGDRVNEIGIAFVPARQGGANLSGGMLALRYSSSVPMGPAIVSLKPIGDVSNRQGIITKELFIQLDQTKAGQEEIRIPLPATPGLNRIKEIVITCRHATKGRPVDLLITGFTITPQGK